MNALVFTAIIPNNLYLWKLPMQYNSNTGIIRQKNNSQGSKPRYIDSMFLCDVWQ